VSLAAWLITAGAGLLLGVFKYLGWRRAKAEGERDAAVDRARDAEAVTTATRTVEADRAAGERREDRVEEAARKASTHKDRVAARERMKLRGGR
jgi:hypothetical protein